MAKNKAIFIDRDGVINENIYEPDGQIMAPANLDQLKIKPLVKEGIAKIKSLGFKIISITNQPGVAFGYLLPEKLRQINDFLKKELGIDEIYVCPHHPKKQECNCRKPKIGLIEMAKKDFDIDVENSYMVGDSLSDIQTGRNAKVRKTFLIGTVREDILEIQHQKNIFPDFTLLNLVEVANKIKDIENY
jgi:histidinol-phosphate phosphatase family protein